MFLEYYKLAEQPFGVTPNPRYLFLTPTHREAMASILYAVMENRGFSALIAPPGMGKTTLLFDLLQRFGDTTRTIFLFQFQPTPEGLLRNILAELEIPDEGESFVGMQEKLNQAILSEAKRGRRIVVVVDEAQNFCAPVLEVLRMLSNFETSQDKLIHIILSGQPQLAELLFSPAIEQLRQRVSIMAVLRPLNGPEVRQYIEHRLRIAGYPSARPLFTPAACELIAEYSGGIPRNINNYCFNAMSLGFALKKSTLDREIIAEVFRDLNLADATVSAARGPLREPAGVAPQIAFAPLPTLLPKTQSSGRGLRFAAGAFSIAAVLCVAGILANERLHLPSRANISVPAPAPPVAMTTPEETTPNSSVDSDAQPEAVPQPTPESSSIQTRDVRAVVPTQVPPQTDAPIARQERVKLVKATQDETLYQLCRRNVPGCNAGALREIQRLNPWLHNPNRLQAGQPVRVPLELSLAGNRQTTATKINSGEKR